MVVFIVKPSKIKILQVCAIFYLPFIRVSEVYSKKFVIKSTELIPDGTKTSEWLVISNPWLQKQIMDWTGRSDYAS